MHAGTAEPFQVTLLLTSSGGPHRQSGLAAEAGSAPMCWNHELPSGDHHFQSCVVEPRWTLLCCAALYVL